MDTLSYCHSGSDKGKKGYKTATSMTFSSSWAAIIVRMAEIISKLNTLH